jgi:hypothetical protein
MDQNNAPVLRVGEWFLTMFLLAIPIVNLVMALVWSFGGGANPTKANFAKAYLLWMLIGLVFFIAFYVIFGAAMFSMMDAYGY